MKDRIYKSNTPVFNMLKGKKFITGTYGVFLLSIFLLFFVNIVSADSNSTGVNLTSQEKAFNCLQESRVLVDELINNNFSSQRVNDSMDQAQSYYDAQVIIQGKTPQKANFQQVLQSCAEITSIHNLAIGSRDLYETLIKVYQDSFATPAEQKMDRGSIELMLQNIDSEIKSERYELVSDLVDKTYEEIARIKSENTAINLFYKQTTQTLAGFFIQNWISIVVTIVVLMILYFIYRKTILRKIIGNKIAKLELKKNNLKNLIMKTQKDYFQDGKISDSAYKIRIANFGEMIRDVNRQIPLLQEELLKIGRKRNEGNNKK